LSILTTIPLEDLERAGSPRFAEAISRMRKGDVAIKPGFDGEYGKVRIFD
jgi:PHP family Zn ribbon phosphoesterase